MAEFNWIDKVDGVDDVYAEDVNALAAGIVANSSGISANTTKIDANTAKIDKNTEAISNLKDEVGNISPGNDKGKNEIVISPWRTASDSGGDTEAHNRSDYVLTADNGAANVAIINEAISKLSHEDGSEGGEIVFLGGTVPISSGIVVDKSNVKISGNGVCFQLTSLVDENVFNISGEDVSVSDCNFSDHESLTNYMFSGHIFYVTGSGFIAENCDIESEMHSGWFFYVNASHCSINNCYSELVLASNNGFFLKSYHSSVSNCNFYSVGIPIVVQGHEVSVISNTFSSYASADFLSSSGAKVFGNVFEMRDIVPAVLVGSGNFFVGNRFTDEYGYENESDSLVEISNNNILIGNEFVTNHIMAEYPALKINGSNNIYVANILDGVLDNGKDNITYLTSADKTTINNTLESESETEALSANMGRELNGKISTLETAISGVETILADANAVADSYIEGGTA